MAMEKIKYTLSDAIGFLTINRPESLNALNTDLLNELKNIIKNLHQKKPRALIIQGAGEKAFVAGADIKEMQSFNANDAQAFAQKGQEVFSLIESLPFPVIAAVDGFALGGGLELALACDIIVMSDRSTIGLPELSLGLIPAFGGTQRLLRAVGLYKAKEMIFSGRLYSAKSAKEMGLVSYIINPNQMMSEVKKLAEDIKQKGPLAAASIKSLVHQAENTTLQHRLSTEAKEFGNLFHSNEPQEGMKAFIEKRKPWFGTNNS